MKFVEKSKGFFRAISTHRPMTSGGRDSVAAVETDLVGRAAMCLNKGGIVLLPTDTVYGLAVHPVAGMGSLERLFAMKRRPASRKLPIMVADRYALVDLGARVNEPASRLLAAFTPGALTLALGVDEAKAPSWLAGRDEIAVRIPAEESLLEILRETGPLLVTSANLHNESTPESAESALRALDGEPDLVIDGGTRNVVPSTLVNCNVEPPRIERVGWIPEDKIEGVLR